MPSQANLCLRGLVYELVETGGRSLSVSSCHAYSRAELFFQASLPWIDRVGETIQNDEPRAASKKRSWGKH